jgi:hypothetical protein
VGSIAYNRRKEGGPFGCGANARGARSLRLTQPIIIGFVKPLDFCAVEALVTDLQECAKGFRRA